MHIQAADQRARRSEGRTASQTGGAKRAARRLEEETRVGERAVEAHRPVKVGACRVAGVAFVTDHLTVVDGAALWRRALRNHVGVPRLEALTVSDDHDPGGIGAVVRDSIVMFDSVIRSGAVVDRAILDKEVVVGPGAIVGDGPDFDTPNKQEPGRLNTGITVVGKRAIIPRGVRIGRNVKIAGDVKATDFASRIVKSGASIESARPKTAAARLAAQNRGTEKRVAVAVEPSTNGHREPVVVGRAGRSGSGAASET
jgi:hypothetical protein